MSTTADSPQKTALWGDDDALVRVQGLTLDIETEQGTAHILRGVSMAVRRGETLGIVGESGAGKSTVGRMVLGLVDPTSGTVRVAGVDVAGARGASRRRLRREVQAVFQNPYASLDPTMTIGDSVAEPLVVHSDLSRDERRARVQELLGQVGLDRLEELDDRRIEADG